MAAEKDLLMGMREIVSALAEITEHPVSERRIVPLVVV